MSNKRGGVPAAGSAKGVIAASLEAYFLARGSVLPTDLLTTRTAANPLAKYTMNKETGTRRVRGTRITDIFGRKPTGSQYDPQ